MSGKPFYLKGRFFWNKRTATDLRKSIDYFQQAIAKDPNYALAYASSAQAWLLLPGYSGGTPNECFPQAESAAKKRSRWMKVRPTPTPHSPW